MFKLLKVSLLLVLASCALSGRSTENGVSKYITGATKVDELRNVHVIHIVRAIGVPNNNIVIGKYKYYQWDYSRVVGVSTLLGGGSTTFYCKFSAETQNNKIKTLNWYGNQCDIFLDQIKDYFQDKFNLSIIAEEDSKVAVTSNVVGSNEKKDEDEPKKEEEKELKKDPENKKEDKADIEGEKQAN